MSKTFVQKLGLEPVDKYNQTNLKKRIRTLEKNLKDGVYKGQKKEKARTYLYWFRSKLNQLKAA